jgi:hypothetical protein
MLPLSPEFQTKAELRFNVQAAMETGNHGAARTLLREIQEADEEFGRDIQLDVLGVYGIML